MAETIIRIIKQSNKIAPQPLPKFNGLSLRFPDNYPDWGFHLLICKICPGFPPLLRMYSHDITVAESNGKYP